MTDDRYRSSSSDELLREARQRVMDGELYSDDPIDASPRRTNDESDFEDAPPGLTPDDGSDATDTELSAAEIAAQLAQVQEAANPTPAEPEGVPNHGVGNVADQPPAGMRSLPDWALEDEPSTPAASRRESDAASAVVPSESASLAERIRALAEGQGVGDTPDEPVGENQPPPPTDAERDEWFTPSPDWQSQSESTKGSGTTMSWVRPVISLAVFAFLGIGFVAAQLDGSEPIEQLAVGDCFDAGDAVEVYDVPVIECNELHGSELYGKVEIEGFGSTYPGDDPLFDWVNARCEDQFSAYVGEPYEDSRYWIEVFMPTEDGWDDGDRVGLCTVVLVDDNYDIRPSLGSARGWGERST